MIMKVTVDSKKGLKTNL